VFPLVPSIDTVGPIANAMDLIDAAYRVLSEDDSPARSPQRARIGIPQPWYDSAPMGDGVAEAFEHAVESLRGMGHEVRTIEMPGVLPSIHIVHAIAPEVREVHRPFRERGESYGEDVAARLDDAEKVTEEEIVEAKTWQKTMRDRFADAFATVDFLVTPTVPVRRKVIGVDSIGDKHYRSVLSYFTSLVNHALHPALAMPLAHSGEPPVSLQAIGPLHGEAALIGLGRALESESVAAFRIASGWDSVNAQA
jgi:Asp-tRNA(Asn)/Glu-tRNA(Gln) amidotransferase A subunit family amidase